MTVKLTKLEMNIFHLFFLYGHLIFIIYRIITNNYISNTVVCAFSKENLPFHKKRRAKNRAPHIHPNYQLVYRSRHARKTIECPRNGKRSIRDKLKACWRQSFCTGKHTEKICMVGPDCGNLYGKRPCKFQRLT